MALLTPKLTRKSGSAVTVERAADEIVAIITTPARLAALTQPQLQSLQTVTAQLVATPQAGASLGGGNPVPGAMMPVPVPYSAAQLPDDPPLAGTMIDPEAV